MCTSVGTRERKRASPPPAGEVFLQFTHGVSFDTLRTFEALAINAPEDANNVAARVEAVAVVAWPADQ